MNKQQQFARDAAIDSILDYIFTDGFGNKAHRLVMEFEEPLNGRTGWWKAPIRDKLAELYDAAKGESVTVKAEPPDLKSILLEIVFVCFVSRVRCKRLTSYGCAWC